MGSGVAFLLLATVAGYWVLERAATHKGRLKKTGQIVGMLIIIISLVGVACKIFCSVGCTSGVCPTESKWKKGGFCPYTQKALQSQEPVQK